MAPYLVLQAIEGSSKSRMHIAGCRTQSPLDNTAPLDNGKVLLADRKSLRTMRVGRQTMLRRSFIVTTVGAAVAAAVVPMTNADAATAATTLLVLVYSNGAYPARPAGTAAGCARYIGPIQPQSWLIGDEWIQPSS